jgi:hypothetical protein
VTEEQQIEHVLKEYRTPQKAEDRSPTWARLLKSLRVTLKPGNSVKRPIKQVVIKGGVEF